MAAKKPTKPKKFKQARTAAKADAKKVFKGKAQARLKDATTKLSADDAKTLSDVAKEARGNYITDAQGNKIKTQVTPDQADRYDREGRRAREAFREQMREEGLYEKKADAPAKKAVAKKAVAKKAAAKPKKVGKNFGKYGTMDEYKIEKGLEKEAKAKKAAVNKPAVKGFAAGKELNATGKARYDALIKEGVAPKKALNKALFAQEKASKSSSTLAKSEKEIADLKKNNPKKYAANEKAFKDKVKTSIEKKPKFVQSTRTNAPATTKEVAVRPKPGTPVAPAKAAAKPAAKKFGKLRKGAKGFVGVTLATEAVSALKGSTEKDWREIQKLENRLAVAQGKPRKYTNMGSTKNFGESSKADLSNLANLVTMGAVGKTRRGRMDELNAKIVKAEAAKSKRIAKQRAAKPGISPAGARSSSKINKTFVTAGGSTTNVAPGSRYTVKKGDTLSAIAKSAGVKVSDVLAVNPKIADKKSKYKGGSMIWSGTKVKLPTKK
jgi:LysM repeat protein